MEHISSRQNPVVARFREAARDGSRTEWMLLDGPHLLAEALASGTALDIVACDEAHRPEVIAAQRRGARVIAVTLSVLEAISPVRTPSGVVALARRPTTELEDALAGPAQLVFVISDVQDPGNVGAIVRVAEGCGATGIVTTGVTADPYGWKALRGSMGSALRVPIAARREIGEAVAAVRARGLRLIASVARGGTPLGACDLRAPVAVLLGSEGAGLPASVVDLADERLTIVMRPPVESLNVAVAAGLVAYEAARQRS